MPAVERCAESQGQSNTRGRVGEVRNRREERRWREERESDCGQNRGIGVNGMERVIAVALEGGRRTEERRSRERGVQR